MRRRVTVCLITLLTFRVRFISTRLRLLFGLFRFVGWLPCLLRGDLFKVRLRRRWRSRTVVGRLIRMTCRLCTMLMNVPLVRLCCSCARRLLRRMILMIRNRWRTVVMIVAVLPRLWRRIIRVRVCWGWWRRILIRRLEWMRMWGPDVFPIGRFRS